MLQGIQSAVATICFEACSQVAADADRSQFVSIDELISETIRQELLA